MTKALSVRQCQDEALWDAFVTTSPHGSVFCRTPFLRAHGARFTLWLVEAGGAAVAGAVVLLDQDGRARSEPAPFALYQGVLFCEEWLRLPPHTRPSWAMSAAELLLAKLTEHYDRFCLTLPHGIDDLRWLQWLHYHEPQEGRARLDLAYTGVIDLAADFDSYLASIRKERRRSWRRALEQGLTASVSGEIDVLERLDEATFERQGLRRGDDERGLVGSLARAAVERGFGEILVCRDGDGRPLSATLFLYDERSAYYLIGANDPLGRKLGAGDFAFVESLRRCHARGIRRVDVCGINSPRRGEFKISFNARPTPYFVARWSRPREGAR